MTWACKESSNQSDARAFSDEQGVLTYQRYFHVWSDDEDLDDALLVWDRLGQPGTDPNNADVLPTYGDRSPYDNGLAAASPRITLVDSAVQLWLVRWSYLPTSLVAGQGQPNDVGFVQVTIQSSGSFKDAWRSGYSVPTQSIGGTLVYGQLSGTGELNEVGGVPADISGEPMSIPTQTREISVSVTVDQLPILGPLDLALGTRNSIPILGVSAGRLVFVSYSMTPMAQSGRFRFTYQFRSDKDAHLLQYPSRDNLGEVIRSSSGQSFPATGGTLYNFASSVLWRQPFPSLTNFYTLSPYFPGQI
jgi:hypothetical protein